MSLLQVGSINVPSRALNHAHVHEARCIAAVFSVDEDRVERVIGTENKRAGLIPQLYGWGSNVAPHRDGTGFVYFTPLLLRYSVVCTKHHAVRLQRGHVYRLYDHVEHWTLDSAPVVCLFVGPVQFPLDAVARLALQTRVESLARGGRVAPRVSNGFRVPLHGECWADTPTGTELVLIEDAKRHHWIMARCALCERFAVRPDQLFPYHQESSRCAIHLLHDRDVPCETSAALEAA